MGAIEQGVEAHWRVESAWLDVEMAPLEQRFGDVGEDHSAVRANPIERFDADQSIAGSHIEQRRTLERLGVVQYPVANLGQAAERDLPLALVAGVSAFEQPSRPTIWGGCHGVSIRHELPDRPVVFLSSCA